MNWTTLLNHKKIINLCYPQHVEVVGQYDSPTLTPTMPFPTILSPLFNLLCMAKFNTLSLISWHTCRQINIWMYLLRLKLFTYIWSHSSHQKSLLGTYMRSPSRSHHSSIPLSHRSHYLKLKILSVLSDMLAKLWFNASFIQHKLLCVMTIHVSSNAFPFPMFTLSLAFLAKLAEVINCTSVVWQRLVNLYYKKVGVRCFIINGE